MSDLPDRILAAIEEVAQIAQDALRGYLAVTDAGLADWQRSARWYSNYQYVRAVYDIPIPDDVLERGDIWTNVAAAAHGNFPAATHIARQGPQTTLRRCEADKRTVERHSRVGAREWVGIGHDAELRYRCEACWRPIPCPDLLDRAAAYDIEAS